MIVHYGYTDAQGDFRISIDTDKCDGCGICADICPAGLFCLEEDDYDEIKAEVKQAFINKVGILCPGSAVCKKLNRANCIESCPHSALSITF